MHHSMSFLSRLGRGEPRRETGAGVAEKLCRREDAERLYRQMVAGAARNTNADVDAAIVEGSAGSRKPVLATFMSARGAPPLAPIPCYPFRSRRPSRSRKQRRMASSSRSTMKAYRARRPRPEAFHPPNRWFRATLGEVTINGNLRGSLGRRGSGTRAATSSKRSRISVGRSSGRSSNGRI
jgi:hypothetical protein